MDQRNESEASAEVETGRFPGNLSRFHRRHPCCKAWVAEDDIEASDNHCAVRLRMGSEAGSGDSGEGSPSARSYFQDSDSSCVESLYYCHSG